MGAWGISLCADDNAGDLREDYRELIAYRLRSGDHMIVRVTDLHTDKGGTYPSCEVLDWQGKVIPDAASLQRFGLRPVRRDTFFALFTRADKSQELGEEFSRIEIV